MSTDTYDNNGSTIGADGKNYTYDYENRITSVNGNNLAITIKYDGDGNRVEKTVNGVTTKYLVDTNNLTGYAQVVEEIQNSIVSRQYSYGLDLISQRQLIGNDRTTSFYNYDGHGSVRGLTDSNGVLTDSFTYDAYGNLIDRTGSTPNNYLYAGEQFDFDLNLYYNRARYLDVNRGRFWSKDSYEGDNGEPPSLHKYLYANGDPVNKNDPSGNLSGVVGISQILVFAGVRLTAYAARSQFAYTVFQTVVAALLIVPVVAGTVISGKVDPKQAPSVNPPESEIKSDPQDNSKPQKEEYVFFVHGTSPASALSINTIGVSEDALRANEKGNSRDPGTFFTFLLGPPNNPGPGLQIAYELAATKVLSGETRALLIGKLPKRIFDKLLREGSVKMEKLGGSPIPETAFKPPSFPSLNQYNLGRWQVIYKPGK